MTKLSQKREEKAKIVTQLQEKFSNSQNILLADYRGLNVAEITRLRRELRIVGVELKIYKNTLIKRALNETGIEGLESYLEGPTALAISPADPVAPAKTLLTFGRTNKNLVIKAGVLQGKVISADVVRLLADLPSREVLLARTAGALRSPLDGMASVLAGLLRNLVYVLDQVREQKETATS